MSEPRLGHVDVNGVRLAYFERGEPRPGRASILFVHATGFHGRIWDYIAERLPGEHMLALEQRGHGRSSGGPIDHWQVFGDDMAAFVRELGLEGLLGVGHSMGAHALIDGAALSGAFARLVLLDPTVGDPEEYASGRLRAAFPEGTHPASKRRETFASVEEMIERMRGKSSFDLYHPQILDDYCRHGLVPAEDGSLRLACPPEVEASVYMASRENTRVFESARSLDIPVTVIRAKRPPAERGVLDWSSSPTWPGLWKLFPRGREMHWSQCTHFIPMQMPDRVLGVIRAELEAMRWADR